MIKEKMLDKSRRVSREQVVVDNNSKWFFTKNPHLPRISRGSKSLPSRKTLQCVDASVLSSRVLRTDESSGPQNFLYIDGHKHSYKNRSSFTGTLSCSDPQVSVPPETQVEKGTWVGAKENSREPT